MKKSMKHKASQFFRDGPSQDEKVANNALDGFDFDAGIHDVSPKPKALRFFRRRHERAEKVERRDGLGRLDKFDRIEKLEKLDRLDRLDKPLPAPPSNASSTSLPSEQQTVYDPPQGQRRLGKDITLSEKPLPFPPAPLDLAKDERSTSYAENSPSQWSLSKADSPKAKTRPRLATLRSKSSRFFRSSERGSHSPPPPPLPQIPVLPEEPTPPIHILPQLHPLRNSPRTSTISSSGRSISISRPLLLHQSPLTPLPKHLTTVPFTKPPGPSPHRPPRPPTIDPDTLALMQETGARILPTLPFTSSSSLSSPPAPAHNNTPSSVISSINARLGFPTGYATPRKPSLDAALAVRLPLYPCTPLPVRDNKGCLAYSRFSEYVRLQGGDGGGSGGGGGGGYSVDDDDDDDADGAVGPVERYVKGKKRDWKLVKRVSKGMGGGHPGMLFRDRWNGFHFVADV